MKGEERKQMEFGNGSAGTRNHFSFFTFHFSLAAEGGT